MIVLGAVKGCGLEVDRKDNDLGYVPSNLRRVSRKVNGQNRNICKLTQEDANNIRELAKSGHYTQAQIASGYKVDGSHISRIVSGQHWN